MTTETIMRICEHHAALAKASPEKGPDILVDLVKALAADRAGTVFLALEPRPSFASAGKALQNFARGS